ncbi:MAG: metal-dependent transcriptional regulator [Chloroflexi bacterium]|nr:MAG: metal-dependent transcriptional regulator [Chloroflexota bacterium]RLC93443.1 MAG: metal-dependent transcriptional regulator [Chloroflexota bacterium]
MEKEQTASMEDYLEAVAMLRRRGKAVRVKEISQALGVKMPSVTAALKKLSDDGLVEHERYGRVKLTPAGDRAAKSVFHRHQVLLRFLTQVLSISPQIAVEDACRMEHSISPITLERLSKFLEFAGACPRERPSWLENYKHYLEYGQLPASCPEKSVKE